MCCMSKSVHRNLLINSTPMTFHPTGVIVEIVGTTMSSNGRSCEHHSVCGEVLEEDVVVRLRRVQIVVDGKEETAIAAIWVTDGCDRCRVGFLPRHMVAHASTYDGALAQVTAVLSDDKGKCNTEERHRYHKMRGCCMATIISMHASNGGDDLGSADEDANSNADSDDDSGYEEEEPRLETQPLTPVKWSPIGEKKAKRIKK